MLIFTQPGPISDKPTLGQDTTVLMYKIDVTKPYKLIGFGAINITKPYRFIGFGAIDVTKPYKFIRFGATDVTKPHKFIRFGEVKCKVLIRTEL